MITAYIRGTPLIIMITVYELVLSYSLPHYLNSLTHSFTPSLTPSLPPSLIT